MHKNSSSTFFTLKLNITFQLDLQNRSTAVNLIEVFNLCFQKVAVLAKVPKIPKKREHCHLIEHDCLGINHQPFYIIKII